jgi:hypothetical protein
VKTLEPGTRVRLTKAYLRKKVRFPFGDKFSRWKTVACSCRICQEGKAVALDEPHPETPGRQRHCLVKDLEKDVVSGVPS